MSNNLTIKQGFQSVCPDAHLSPAEAVVSPLWGRKLLLLFESITN